MTNLKQLAEASAENGKVRLEWVYRLMDLASKEAELKKITKQVNA